MRRAAKLLIPIGLGVLFAVGAGAPLALADEVEHGDGTVTITVTIDPFDPCAVGAEGCEEGGGELAMTGAAIGIPLGSAILLAAAGAGAIAVSRQRRAAKG